MTTTNTPAPVQTPAPGALTPTLDLIPAFYLTRRGVQPVIRFRRHHRKAH